VQCRLVSPLWRAVSATPLVIGDDLGDAEFRGYFVVQTPTRLERYERYERFVAPAVPLVDWVAVERIGRRWQLTVPDSPTYRGPTLVIAGRQTPQWSKTSQPLVGVGTVCRTDR